MKRSLVWIVMTALAAGTAVFAAQPAPSAAPPQGFVPVQSFPQVEQLPAAPLLIAAYAFVWVALIGYVWSLWRRMTRVERDLADLQHRVHKP
jgi:CcmD family protein